MVKKEEMTKGAYFFFTVAKVVLVSQWLAYTLSLFICKDFPSWLFRPIGWVYWVFGCLALLGLLATKLGLNDEHKG